MGDDNNQNHEAAALLSRFSSLVRVPDRQTPDQWAAKNRVYGPETGRPGPRDPFLSPSLVPLGRAATSGLYTRAVAVTSAQMGKTEAELDIIGQRLAQRPTPILYVGPSAEFNRDQFEPRLKGLIDQSDDLRDKLVRGRREKKALKIIAGVRVRLASAGSSTALKSDPVGLGLVDEYDEMASNVRGQGDPIGLVEARGETYADFVLVVTSTPGRGVVEVESNVVGHRPDGSEIRLEFFAVGDPTEIESPIWRLFQEGTRHHWATHCPCCSEVFIPMRKHLKWDPGATPAQARRSAYIECPANGCVIQDDENGSVAAQMNASGFMLAPGQTIEEAKAGENLPDTSTYSQWSSGLCSPFVSWGSRAERMVKAEMSGEEDKVQTAVNTNFGELYTPGLTGDLPDWEGLLRHKTEFAPGVIHRGILHIVMGVDVQKRGLYYSTRGFGARGTSWLVENGYLIGETSEDLVWEQLANIMLTPISGVHIEKVMVDAGFRPDKPDAGSVHRVYDFCRQYSFLAHPCRGRSTMGGRPYSVSSVEVKQDGSKRAFSMPLAMINTDFFKSLVHTRIKTPSGHPGAFYLHSEADETYARQVLSEVRIIHPGKPKPEWKPVRRDNHYFDCEVLCAVGAYTLNVQQIPEGVERSWGDDDAAPPDDGATDTAARDGAEEETETEADNEAKEILASLRTKFRR